MRITIFADASYCPTHRVGGYGFWIASARGKISGGGRLRTDNIETSGVAEMMALANALHSAIISKLVLDNDSVLLQTDCMSAIDAFTGTRKRLSLQEQQVFTFMHGLVEKGGLKLQYRHVKGHTGNRDARSVTNHLCDQRAKQGLKAARIVKQTTELRKLLEKTDGPH